MSHIKSIEVWVTFQGCRVGFQTGPTRLHAFLFLLYLFRLRNTFFGALNCKGFKEAVSQNHVTLRQFFFNKKDFTILVMM